MSLTIWELKKLFGRATAKAAFFFAVLVAIMCVVLYNFNFLGSLADTGAKNWDGPAEVARQYKWADSWRGSLTGDKLAKAKEQFNTAFLPEYEQTAVDGSVWPSNEAYDKFITPLGPLPDFLRNTFSFLPEYSTYLSFSDVPVSFAQNYYEQREQIISMHLQTKLPNEADRQFFLNQNAKVETPFYYDWYEGHSTFNMEIQNLMLIIVLAICIVIAPVFAGEYRQKTDSVLLCSKHGRKKLARAKLSASLIASAVIYITCMGIYLTGQLAFLGTRALNCPVQLINPFATAPLTIWQLEAFAFGLGFLCCMALTALTAFLSSRLSSPFPVIIIASAFIILPLAAIESLPDFLQKVVALFPFVSGSPELLRTNLYHIMGLRIWSPYMLFIIPAALVLLCLPFAVRGYNKHEA